MEPTFPVMQPLGWSLHQQVYPGWRFEKFHVLNSVVSFQRARYGVKSGTHRPEELLHVSRIGVHDQFVDLLLPDLAEYLPVSTRRCLSDVHFSAHCGGYFYQILKFEQTCKHPRHI